MSVTADTVRDLYREMIASGATTGNEAVYVYPDLKTSLFGDDPTLLVDGVLLPIIADTALPTEEIRDGIHETCLYILDVDAYQEALRGMCAGPDPLFPPGDRPA